MNLIIIKLGGSVITAKESNKPLAKIDVINNLSKELKKFHKSYQIILIHGAGSFGHPLAKKYNLNKGLTSSTSTFGAALTSLSMINLNQIILKELLAQKLPAITLPPRAFITQSKKTTTKIDTKIIEGLLEKNFIPVLFGDVVLDLKQGVSIISGDLILAELAKKLSAKKVIFLSDVDGIFTRDPKKHLNAELITEINNKNIAQILKKIEINNPQDVTGEMRGKIQTIKDNLPNIEVFIINGLRKNRLRQILEDKKVGTSLFLES